MTYMTYKTYKKTGFGYEKLVVYWLACTIYDLTVEFCKTYMSYKTYKSYTRTYDQMIQAARSGKQNIVEGSLNPSAESGLKLGQVARASFGELLEDYKDFLRQRHLLQWAKDDPRVMAIRRQPDLPYKTYKSYTTYTTYLSSAESFGNLMVTLCYKELYLLSRYLKANEVRFVSEGGFRENLLKKRLEYRRKYDL